MTCVSGTFIPRQGLRVRTNLVYSDEVKIKTVGCAIGNKSYTKWDSKMRCQLSILLPSQLFLQELSPSRWLQQLYECRVNARSSSSRVSSVRGIRPSRIYPSILKEPWSESAFSKRLLTPPFLLSFYLEKEGVHWYSSFPSWHAVQRISVWSILFRVGWLPVRTANKSFSDLHLQHKRQALHFL